MQERTEAVVESSFERGDSCPECGGETYPEPMVCHGGPREETAGFVCERCSWSVLQSVVEREEEVVVLREECPTQRGFGGAEVPVPAFCSSSCSECGAAGYAADESLRVATVVYCAACAPDDAAGR